MQWALAERRLSMQFTAFMCVLCWKTNASKLWHAYKTVSHERMGPDQFLTKTRHAILVDELMEIMETKHNYNVYY